MRKRTPILVLASASPRRRSLLGRAGIAFRARPVFVEEKVLPGEKPRAYVLRLARQKAGAARRTGELVLGADTAVVLGRRILGKPRDRREAARMLRLLSGRLHRVLTGICLLGPGPPRAGVVESRVWFRRLSRAEIAAYVASGEPMDKAGAYAIQGLASKFVRRIEGCCFNVMGLPVARVYDWLNQQPPRLTTQYRKLVQSGPAAVQG